MANESRVWIIKLVMDEKYYIVLSRSNTWLVHMYTCYSYSVPWKRSSTRWEGSWHFWKGSNTMLHTPGPIFTLLITQSLSSWDVKQIVLFDIERSGVWIQKFLFGVVSFWRFSFICSRFSDMMFDLSRPYIIYYVLIILMYTINMLGTNGNGQSDLIDYT